jgi:D-sedoheptulose 7-phosphate isomerase
MYGYGLRATALSANIAVVRCLANDEGYEEIFSMQLVVQARAGDVLIVLPASGNSPNIIRVLEQAKVMDLKSSAILGLTGGRAKAIVDVPIHLAVSDMQISDDMQMVVGHMVMPWLCVNRPPQSGGADIGIAFKKIGAHSE